MIKHHPKLSSTNLPWPTDWTTIFGTKRPLILEIGFGYGQMLEYLHQTRPDANIIGLEVSNFCLDRAENMIPRKGLDRVRVIRARAETALHHLFRPQSLSEVHINFPDPWFKERHAGRRLMQRDTLDAIISRMQPSAKLYLATDILAYAEMSAELLSETPSLTNLLNTPWANDFEDRVTTKYEKKAKTVGRHCYYFMYTRNDVPTPEIPVIEEAPMPHMVIQSPNTLEELFQQLELPALAKPENELHIEFKFRYLGINDVLLDVHIHEPTIDQRVGIAIIRREHSEDIYTVKLSAIGSPRPTEGIHRAVRLIGEAILSLNPEATVIQDKVRTFN